MTTKHVLVAVALAAIFSAPLAWAGGASETLAPLPAKAPGSSILPYNKAVKKDLGLTALVTVADAEKAAAGAYAFRGIPDGIGAYDNGDGTFTVLVNHEIPEKAGAVRAHGAMGAFVSRFVIKKSDLSIVNAADMIQKPESAYAWDGAKWQAGTSEKPVVFGRLCSGDLAAASAFYNPANSKGYNGRIFLNGEEVGDEGRAFAWVANGEMGGTVWATPALGRFAWENAIAHNNSGDATLVVGTDDSRPGQVYLYVGEKKASGNPVEKAGLHGGTLYGVRVSEGGANYSGAATLENNGAFEGSFTLVNLGDASSKTGKALQMESIEKGVTEFARPEDGHWDTKNPNIFYFVTTGMNVKTGKKIADPKDATKMIDEEVAQSARLYKLVFKDIANPQMGGTISLVSDAATVKGTDGQTESARSYDNICVDLDGNIIVQEDPGNTPYLARMWRITPQGKAEQLTVADASLFKKDATGFITEDEENSGVIDITAFFDKVPGYNISSMRYYLSDMQVHKAVGDADVELGQLFLMSVPKN